MKNIIAIIGGTGKAGRYLVQQLVHQKFQLRLLLRDPSRPYPASAGIEVMYGDARDYTTIQTLLQGCHAVISAVGQPKGEPPVFSAITKNILQAMHVQG